MSSGEVIEQVEALRAHACAVGELIAAQGAAMRPDELFEVAGALQGAVNVAEGAQMVAAAHAAAHETRLTERGPVEVRHDLGYIDAMAGSELCLATGLGEWVADRRVALAAALAERFPRLLGRMLTGELASGTLQKVVSACDGLDATACAAVEAVLGDRLADLDPGRVTTVTRRIASRVAADQMATAQRRNRGDRTVQVSPGPDGTTNWWAQLPAERSAAAWSAITTLGETYAEKDASLTADQARADAFLDLLLTNVAVTARVTIGVPVLTGPDADTARQAASALLNQPSSTRDDKHGTRVREDDPVTHAGDDDRETRTGDDDRDTATGEDTQAGAGTEAGACTEAGAAGVRVERPVAVGGRGDGSEFSISTALSGCEIPGIGFIDADTIEALLATVPLEVGRALLDARTGTLIETVSSAYRPPRAIADFVRTRDGTCRMWGCTRTARACDTDHARPWPAGTTTPNNLGALCRRHHRLKQRRRWAHELHPDGSVSWTSPTGRGRTTLPDHMVWPPPPPSPEPVSAATPNLSPQVVEAPPF